MSSHVHDPTTVSDEAETHAQPSGHGSADGMSMVEFGVAQEAVRAPQIQGDGGETVMTHMALGVIGITVGMAGAALLMIGYVTLAPTEVEPTEVAEVASTEELRGLPVRKTIGETHDDAEVPEAENNP